MIDDVIDRIRNEMIDTFNDLFIWFDVCDELKSYRKDPNSWSISEILEHISLTNSYLLILIRKGVAKSLERSSKSDYKIALDTYDLDWEKMKQIGEHGAFVWNRPAHMEPKGELGLSEVYTVLHAQLEECMNCLKQLDDGQGVLYTTMMSVNNCGKIDVYHYIYFVCQHARRHLKQMEIIKKRFEESKN